MNLASSLPLLLIHCGALLVFFVGFSWPAAVAAWCVYWTQILGVSAGYHRYFAHRTFLTSRPFQFLLAWTGAMAAQMGPLWWSSYHRRHHAHADTPRDVHSPRQDGFFWAHIGWVLFENGNQMDPRYVKDWIRFPELRWIDAYRWVPPLGVVALLAAVGWRLRVSHPQLGVTPLQMVVWGFFLATTLMYQVTFSVNSVAHIYGRRRFATADTSRNLWWLALLTNGEGWHNNHHAAPGSERHGFAWWEIDVTHYLLLLLQKLGLIWGVGPAAARVPSLRAAKETSPQLLGAKR